MPPLVAAAAITGIAAVAGSVASARATSSANKRSIEAQRDAGLRAESFAREQDADVAAEHARLEAEDRRRWDTEQQNLARDRAEKDARQAYEDKLRYRKMVNLAQLTGMPTPEPIPNFGGTYTPSAATYAAPGATILSQPSRANAMIAPPGAFDPFAQPNATQGIPLNTLSRRRL